MGNFRSNSQKSREELIEDLLIPLTFVDTARISGLLLSSLVDGLKAASSSSVKYAQTIELLIISKHVFTATRCLPSLVRWLPNGEERGSHLAVDLGGTNLRVHCYTFNEGEDEPEHQFVKSEVPKEVNREKTRLKCLLSHNPRG
jgi:hypothetical protein